MGFGGGVGWGFEGFEGHEGSVCENPACRKTLTSTESKRAAHDKRGEIYCDMCILAGELSDDWDRIFLDMLNDSKLDS
jgi:hypothetical protein